MPIDKIATNTNLDFEICSLKFTKLGQQQNKKT